MHAGIALGRVGPIRVACVLAMLALVIAPASALAFRNVAVGNPVPAIILDNAQGASGSLCRWSAA
jgi:hypothetical protein